MFAILIVGGLTLLASFICSLFEAALYAVTPSQVEVLKKQGIPGAERLARLRSDIEEPIAAILTLNTVAHTVGAAWCGAMVGDEYGSGALGLFAAIFTFLVLVLTEVVPKSLGVRFASSLGPRVAWPIQALVWLMWPVARPARAAMRFLTKGGADSGPSEDEVLVFAKMAAQHGSVREEEHRWVANALRMDKLRAGDLRTPRPVVEMLPASMPVSDALGMTSTWIHSRIPVYGGASGDDPVGVVLRREVFDAAIEGGKELRLKDLMHELRPVPEHMPAHKLLRIFLTERMHLVGVFDEHGGFQGVVTLEDVVEALLGEQIVDEHDRVVDWQEHARDKNPHADSE